MTSPGPDTRIFHQWEDAWESLVAEAVAALPASDRFTQLTRSQECRAALGDKALAAHLPLGEDHGSQHNLLLMNPPRHTALRRCLVRSLPPAHRFRGEIGHVVQAIVNRLSGRADLDITSEFAYPVAMAATCRLMGVPDTDAPQLASQLDLLSAFFDPLATEHARSKAMTAASYMMYYGFRQMRRRSTTPDALLVRLCQLLASKAISREEMISSAVLLFHAAFENTANALSYVGAVVLTEPSIRCHIVRGSRADQNRVLEQLLSLASPARWLARFDPVQARRIAINVAAANRDGGLASLNPAAISSRTRSHLSFGFGPHACIGASLARAEISVAMEALARTPLPSMSIGAVDWKTNPSLFGPTSLRLVAGTA